MLRIEDTDRERSTPGNVEQILDALRWLELDWDEGPVSQFERRQRHGERIRELLDAGRAYPDPTSPAEVKEWRAANPGRGYRGEAREGRGAAIRLRVPDEGTTVVEDLIRGPVSFENRLQDDLVIARSDGTPLYNFAVAVDDAELEITDVVRGDDHLSNTPKQLLVLEALGFTPPRYAHLPLLHGPDGKKLSKRHGAASVQELRATGYLPAAVRNYLALLGWGAEDDETLLSTAQLIERFAIDRVGKGSAIFDERKLRWMNGRYMRELSLDDYVEAVAAWLELEGQAEAAADRDRLRVGCAIAQEKAQTLAEAWALIRFLFEPPVDDPAAWTKVMDASAAQRLRAAVEVLRAAEPYDAEALEARLAELVDRLDAKPGEIYQPLRVAVTGTTVSPGIFDTLAALGRDESVRRAEVAIERLGHA